MVRTQPLNSSPPSSPLALLTRPAPLVALAVLAINDHLLKGAGVVPAVLTGKLSDVAGLFVFSIFCVAITEAATGRRFARAWFAAIAVVFTALKLWPAFNRSVEAVWGVNVLDPTDLLGLVALPVAWLWLRDQDSAPRAGGSRFGRALAAIAIAIACMATPPARQARSYPVWQLRGPATVRAGCASLAFEVSKSGKTGVGVRIRRTIDPAAGACPVELRTAELAIDRGPTVRGAVLSSAAGSDLIHVAFELDNEGLWNDGRRTGTFRFVLDVAGSPVTWRFAAEHRRDGFHVREER